MADFGIYMLLVNNSSYSIEISYDAEDGKDATNLGTLYKGDKSSVMYAGDSFGPHGAEGTFTFKLLEADSNDNLIRVYADCPTSGDNKFEVKQYSQFLKFSQIRFANDPVNLNGTLDWGSEKLPTSGHPLAIQIIVEDTQLPTDLSVMTYNTHLFDGSSAEIGAFFKGKTILYRDGDRAKAIVEKIKANPPSIVCLEEVWSNDMRKQILDDFGDTYPYVYLVPDKGTDLGFFGYAPNPMILIGLPLGLVGIGIVAGITLITGTATVNDLVDKAINTSGLLLLSKYPLANFNFTMFTDLSGDDVWAKKGICTCDVTLPINRNKLHKFRLGFTHAPVNVPKAQTAISLAAEKTMADGKTDSILAGDFNIHQQTASEYDELNQTLNKYNAIDAVYKFIPNIDDSYTDYSENELTIKFFGKKDTVSKDRIDYIYFSPGSQNNHLEPAGAEVFHDWNLSDENIPLSDHYPVKVNFKIKG